MAGHSKWANIKHKKAATDKKRGKLWTKLIREITVAAKEGTTSDPNAHPRLRLAVDKALAGNMPKDTIEKACKRGAGETEGANYEEVRYEGYGPGGIAVMVDCLTDNRNRTVAEVRHAFAKAGGNLGTDGSVAYMFNKTGILSYAPDADEDTIMEAALEASAEDVITNEDGSVDVLAAPDDYQSVLDAMKAAELEPENAEITMRAETLTDVDVETGEKLMRMIDTLEDLDDVQEVYFNANIPDEVMDALG
ncbi:MAG: YebC/PmpR family DNA-binding transcriptional regulator [Gammaproteobacteria bacterium]|nr:MAG: YebC/PmpR family DNA-binding transcriptional regulator [Gammaproteobacteria bacterium]